MHSQPWEYWWPRQSAVELALHWVPLLERLNFDNIKKQFSRAVPLYKYQWYNLPDGEDVNGFLVGL